MTMIDFRSGCKVGWEIFDNEAEAKARAKTAEADACRRAIEGYDFGYQWPGAIQHYADHPVHGECWEVTIP